MGAKTIKKIKTSMKNKGNHQETGIITDVTRRDDGYELSYQECIICYLQDKDNPDKVVPKKGDELIVHTKGGGFGTIRGMDLNGEKIYFKSDEQLELERQKWLDDNEAQKQKEFIDNEKKMDAQYEALPKPFQERIDSFRTNNDTFRIDYEPYELFCCEQAVVIANSCKTPEKIDEFTDLKWEEQKELVSELSSDHSGNTFGCACQLAYWYLKEHSNVAKIHGALSPLVGSDAYGDAAKED